MGSCNFVVWHSGGATFHICPIKALCFQRIVNICSPIITYVKNYADSHGDLIFMLCMLFDEFLAFLIFAFLYFLDFGGRRHGALAL